MINLLPPELKQSYRYASRNVRLLRWATLCAVALVVLAAIGTAGITYMAQQVHSYTAQIASSEASLSQQKMAATEAQVQDISNSIKLAVKVLSKEVLFSKLLAQLATVTPSNAVLTNLDITQTQGAITITAQTADYGSATQLQVNLADPTNKIFSKADIVSIIRTDNGSDPITTHYPYTVVIKALFAPNNPFLFINGKG